MLSQKTSNLGRLGHTLLVRVEAMGKLGTSSIPQDKWKYLETEWEGITRIWQEVAGNTRKLWDLAGTCRNWSCICDYRNWNYFCPIDPLIFGGLGHIKCPTICCNTNSSAKGSPGCSGLPEVYSLQEASSPLYLTQVAQLHSVDTVVCCYDLVDCIASGQHPIG